MKDSYKLKHELENRPIITGIFTVDKTQDVTFQNMKIIRKVFKNCEIAYANFNHSVFQNCTFDNVIFHHCELTDTDFFECHFRFCKFVNMLFIGTGFIKCQVNEMYFTYCAGIEKNLEEYKDNVDVLEKIYRQDRNYLQSKNIINS